MGMPCSPLARLIFCNLLSTPQLLVCNICTKPYVITQMASKVSALVYPSLLYDPTPLLRPSLSSY